MVKVIRKSLRLRQSLKNNIFAASTELELVFFEIAETNLFPKSLKFPPDFVITKIWYGQIATDVQQKRKGKKEKEEEARQNGGASKTQARKNGKGQSSI